MKTMSDGKEDLRTLRADAGNPPVMDIASALDLHCQTVYLALDGKAGRKSTKKIRDYLKGRMTKVAG